MKKSGKRYTDVAKKVDNEKKYFIEDAALKVKETGMAKFDETVDIAVNLGVDPRHADQMVRGSIVLPKGTGKKVKVLVIAKGEKIKEATDAGADFAGAEDMIEKISGGWFGFDRVVATPDMMGAAGKLGKVLGPRGLMPNPKSGTVTFDIAAAIKDIRAGKVEFRVDKGGVVHAIMGKVSFESKDLATNIKTFLESLVRLKPASAKGKYMKGIFVSTTMGPSVKIDELQVSNMLRVN